MPTWIIWLIVAVVLVLLLASLILLSHHLQPQDSSTANLTIIGAPSPEITSEVTHPTRTQDIRKIARATWEYATLSELVYRKNTALASPPKWELERNFPYTELTRAGLYFEIWIRRGDPEIVAVVFRGSDSSWNDWFANIRWIHTWLPGLTDQYTVVDREVALAIASWLRTAYRDRPFQLVAVGHSLGGGLAQHLCFALPNDVRKRVSRVYAFNSSPVHGWKTIKNRALRHSNPKVLDVIHVYEKGELLSFVRALRRYFTPKALRARSRLTIRVNFTDSPRFLKNHSISLLAAELKYLAKN